MKAQMKAQTKRASSPRVECLEGRALLSSFTFSGGTPTVSTSVATIPPIVAVPFSRAATLTTIGNVVSTPGGY